MGILTAFVAGLVLYLVVKVLATALFIVRPDERAVLTSFGRARRLSDEFENGEKDPNLTTEELQRYRYPRVAVIRPGGPYFKWPWQRVHRVSVSTKAVDLVWDPTKQQESVEAVTKDNLTIGMNGQIRFRVGEDHLYAYLFGVSRPLEHVMGYFVSVLRERIATFVDPRGQKLIVGSDVPGQKLSSAIELSEGVSINDLRKNLPLLNQYMEEQCRSTTGRYGIELDAALITTIDAPPEVDHALSAINSTRNQVAADISTAQADSEQQITMSERAVEIADNNAQAEVAPLKELAATLKAIKSEGGSAALAVYLRNMRIPLLSRARRVIQLVETATPRTESQS